MYEKILTTITAVFLVFLLLFTFFSRTLADLQLVQVELAFIAPGTTNPQAVSSGVVEIRNRVWILAPTDGRISDLVSVGDNVSMTSVLFTITNDVSTLIDRKVSDEYSLILADIRRNRLLSDLALEQGRLNQMLGEAVALPTRPILNLFEYDLQLSNLLADMERVRGEIATLYFLYSEGVIPRQDVVNRENEFRQLEDRYDTTTTRRNQAITRYEADIERFYEQVANAEQTRRNQITDQRNRITALNFSITEANIEIERLANRIYELTEQIAAGGTINMTPRMAGHFRILSLNTSEGAVVREGDRLIELGLRNNDFFIEASFSQLDDFIDINHSVNINVGRNTINGFVHQVEMAGGRQNVRIHVTSSDLLGGELAEVRVSGGVIPDASVVPLSAIREDDMGYFISYVVPQPQRFRNHYVVRTQRIVVLRRDARHAAIRPQWALQELTSYPIIVNSDGPFADRQRIRPSSPVYFEAAR